MKLTTTDEIIGQLERGDVARDLATAIGEICAALEAAGEGKASLTLKLKFASKNEVVSIASDIKRDLPVKQRRTTTLFITDGCLSLQHPDQISMFGEQTPARTVPAA